MKMYLLLLYLYLAAAPNSTARNRTFELVFKTQYIVYYVCRMSK